MRYRSPISLLPILLALPAPALAKPVPSRPKPGTKPPLLVALRVQPTQATLNNPREERQLLVTGRFSDGVERDLTDVATYSSATSATARVQPGGSVTSGGKDGTAQVKATLGKLSAVATVTVKGSGVEVPVSFQNEVIPILTKAGCNQGACHGAQHGKGGFKLSLLGYDPQSDYTTIVRQSEGRRVQLTSPEGSLLLTKPTLGVPHAGGRRFEAGSYEYRLLREWLQDGAPAPKEEETAVSRLDALPAQRIADARAADPAAPATVSIPQAKGTPRTLRLPVRQRLAAIATFKDGHTEDVTRKVQFNSLSDGVARVEPEGLAQVVGRGETAIMVRYRGLATVARVTVPYQAATRFAMPFIPRNYIDELVAKKWREMGLAPSGTATDSEFLRRVYLDVLGVLPTSEEARAFLADAAPEKRTKLVEAVLARPEYVDYWTLKWGDLLRNNRDKLGEKGMWSFYNWLRASFRENKPMNRFAEELITAQGSTFTSGPANYFRVAGDSAQQAEVTSQVFLGVRLACAKCHHHPFEKWSQDDYWQMAAFFARVGLKGSDEFGLFGGEQVVRLATGGEVANPRTGKTMKPTPLDGESSDDPIDRRRPLAKWLIAPENPFFSRNIVNRYWGYLLGRGIVEPVDDLRVTNPPSNPALLDALAKDFVEHGYDVKHLLRTILNSAVYQLSPTPTPANRHDEVFQTKYAVKRMGAEELMDALNFATGATDKFPNLPAGMRAVQLPDPKIDNYFLETFGRPARELVCECERSAEPNMAQALHLMNSDFVQNKVVAEGGRVAKLLESKRSDGEIVEELYLVAFCRLPSPEEQERAELAIASAPNRKEGLEDLLWALLNTREFLFIH